MVSGNTSPLTIWRVPWTYLGTRSKFQPATSIFEKEAKARSTLEESSAALNEGLQNCLREGWIQSSTDRIIIGEHKLEKGEFKDKRWPWKILVRRRYTQLISAARSIPRLSNPSSGLYM